MSYKPKTSVKDIPVANEALYTEVARLTRQKEAEVREQVEFIGEFIARTMVKGEMQGVMVPYFGKFLPKAPRLRALKLAQKRKANGSDIIFKALRKGKVPKTGKDETI